MRRITIDPNQCDGCEECLAACPFDALALSGGVMKLLQSCRYCRKCIPACQQNAIIYTPNDIDDEKKHQYRGILIVGETGRTGLSRETLELVQLGVNLSKTLGDTVTLVVMAEKVRLEWFTGLPVAKVIVFEDEAFSSGDPQCFGAAIKQVVDCNMFNCLLFSATVMGKSIAPWVATKCDTGLTADCTELRMRRNGDLIQIRPAFGGEIMARIITPSSRPQMATVRPRLVQAVNQQGENIPPLEWMKLTGRKVWTVIEQRQVLGESNITKAKALLVVGRGVATLDDVNAFKHLAREIGAEFACSRALVEKGWCKRKYQVGLSGQSVDAELVVTLGVSGSIQFLAGIHRARRVIAINTDKDAPIFKRADIAIVMDLKNILVHKELAYNILSKMPRKVV